MGFDGKYGRVTTEHGERPEYGPAIVLGARDIRTRAVLGHERRLCDEGGSPVRHLRLVAETMARFIRWQEDNPDKVRTPDSERSRAWLGK